MELSEQRMEQAMTALEKANEVRFAKARDKRRIKTGELNPATLLRVPPDHWQTAQVIELLIAMRYVGRHRASKWLRTEGVPMTATIGELPGPKLRALANHVEGDLRRRLAA